MLLDLTIEKDQICFLKFPVHCGIIIFIKYLKINYKKKIMCLGVTVTPLTIKIS